MKVIKIISFILACILLSVAVIGCAREQAVEQEEAPASTTEVFIDAAAITEYTVIRAEGADEATVSQATRLYLELKSRFGDKMVFTTDYANKNEIPTDTKEILVGLTNRAETRGVRYSDYFIGYENDRVIVNGGSSAAVAEAVDYFISSCISENGVTVPVSYSVEKSYPMENLTANGELLKDFSVKEIDGELDDTLREYLGERVGIYSRSPEGKEIILTTDSKYGPTELDIYMENGNLIIANSEQIGDASFALEYFMNQLKSVKDGEITLVGNISMTIDGCKSATSQEIAALRAQTDARIAEIRATKNMTIPTNATVYYVSNNGNDRNDGRTPATAWATLKKVSNSSISSGSYVCFERGGLWRGKLEAQAGVTYTAYGTGAKPVLYGSPENGADPTKWKKQSENIWYYDGAGNWGDVGTLVFNEGESCAIKVVRQWNNGYVYNWTTGESFEKGYMDLNTDLQFYHDMEAKKLYIYSEINPGNRFWSIEFNVKQTLISVGKDGVTVDNLCLKYTGSHGVGASTVKNLTVQNCEFGWIGGSIQGVLDGTTWETRFGNAVEIYGGCENYTVQNNYIYQIYDAGITHQYSGVGNKVYNHTNVSYLNNVIENCVYSIEYFVSGCKPENPSVMTNFRIEGNHMWYASRGFCEQRPVKDRSWGAHIKGRCSATGNRANGYIIKNNIFVDGRDRLVQITSNLFNPDGSDSMPTFEGNIFVEEYGRKFGQIEQSNTPENQIDAKYNFDVLAYISERTFGRSKDNEIWFYKNN